MIYDKKKIRIKNAALQILVVNKYCRNIMFQKISIVVCYLLERNNNYLYYCI